MELEPRAPVGALSDIEAFLSRVQHLKALTLQCRDLSARHGRVIGSMRRQIAAETGALDETAKRNPRVRELWKDVKTELHSLQDEREGAT